MDFQYNDGGRAAAGYRGTTRDCVCRAIAIAARRPYSEVYERLAAGNAFQRKSSRAQRATGEHTAGHGIQVQRKWFKDYMRELGFEWTATMSIGSGCRVHLSADELPHGRLVVQVSKHSVAVINGVIHDTHNPDRGETRCVYGYWKLTSTINRETNYESSP